MYNPNEAIKLLNRALEAKHPRDCLSCIHSALAILESEPEPTEYINHFACTKQYLINLITIIRDGPLAFNASEPVMEHLNALFARLIKDGINIDRLTAELKTKDKALQNIIDESGKVDKSNWPRQQQLCQVIAQEVLKYGE